MKKGLQRYWTLQLVVIILLFSTALRCFTTGELVQDRYLSALRPPY
ncbi:MAG: hypothetical protein ACFFCH_03015 [Promethearchaeota archaeon]